MESSLHSLQSQEIAYDDGVKRDTKAGAEGFKRGNKVKIPKQDKYFLFLKHFGRDARESVQVRPTDS